MLLTEAESEFLAVYVDEYMAVEAGPAGRKLCERGIAGTDILHLLDAYMRANLPRVELRTKAGHTAEVLLWGRSEHTSPTIPWPDQASARQRNAELLRERESTQPPVPSEDGIEPSP